ncbi:hypothetical protein [Cochlodiniinecator piscidefendens]|uniref:hypothetical protein n=1 Tax=Cochlodiniinecator piscidefendens TaxID=2715756 RepID=UPI00140CF6D6|nr:hypothetical protein [Cochlodiniinecator piscidefendens]
MIKKTLSAIVVAAALVGSTSATLADTAHIPLTDDVQGTRTSWGGASRGETTYLYSIVNMNGKVGVCGGFYTEGVSIISIVSREQLRSASLYLGDTRLKRNLGYFTQLDLDAPADTLTLRCRDVNIAWQEGMETQELRMQSNQRNFEY